MKYALIALTLMSMNTIAVADTAMDLEAELESCIAQPPSFAEDAKNLDEALDIYFKDRPEEIAERWPKQRVINHYLDCLTACHSEQCVGFNEQQTYNHHVLEQIQSYYSAPATGTTSVLDPALGLNLLPPVLQVVAPPEAFATVPDTKINRLQTTRLLYSLLPGISELDRNDLQRSYDACIKECDESHYPFFARPPLLRFDDPEQK